MGLKVGQSLVSYSFNLFTIFITVHLVGRKKLSWRFCRWVDVPLPSTEIAVWLQEVAIVTILLIGKNLSYDHPHRLPRASYILLGQQLLPEMLPHPHWFSFSLPALSTPHIWSLSLFPSPHLSQPIHYLHLLPLFCFPSEWNEHILLWIPLITQFLWVCG